jgi:osmotically-inducible protein OsmY
MVNQQTAVSMPIASRSMTCDQNRDRDRRIAAVQAALLASGHRAVARLECELVDGSIKLGGIVSSYYLKQVAQEAVMRLKIVSHVHNAIQVQRERS